ncbi:uncharacterized protein C8Q71DRAFT_328057 [Rhodofomes roseus]|uniref:Uncharacterized protein n=1 Tax=Rhodofomes roseus TaxID=34475 RepID=A0ABQ8KTJ0_9APHY|nr:uncharacterized protein C8Q71DRAFT_328057 [Rhodofomes roseus]KAH9841406.1 hypothetical protein C8Q71DRAFT_328057 [Rhodofomes roseus]
MYKMDPAEPPLPPRLPDGRPYGRAAPPRPPFTHPGPYSARNHLDSNIRVSMHQCSLALSIPFTPRVAPLLLSPSSCYALCIMPLCFACVACPHWSTSSPSCILYHLTRMTLQLELDSCPCAMLAAPLPDISLPHREGDVGHDSKVWTFELLAAQ